MNRHITTRRGMVLSISTTINIIINIDHLLINLSIVFGSTIDNTRFIISSRHPGVSDQLYLARLELQSFYIPRTDHPRLQPYTAHSQTSRKIGSNNHPKVIFIGTR